MAVTSTLTMRFKITDNTYTTFDTQPINLTVSTMTQLFQADVLVAQATVDRQISIQQIAQAQQLFFMADQAVELKLIPQGQTLPGVPVGLNLMPGVPSLLSVQNIVAIYVSNNSGQQARLIIQGAGI